MCNDARRTQSNCLVSSRISNGLGGFKDYGDGKVSATAVYGPWEVLFTHSGSCGYSCCDNKFKIPKELIRLLATVLFSISIKPKQAGKELFKLKTIWITPVH